MGGEVRVRRWILIRSPHAPRFASWTGLCPPSGLAARVPIMYRDVEVCAARGGAPLIAAGTPVDPDSFSTRLAPLPHHGGVCILPARAPIVDGDVWTFGACVRSEEQWWEDTMIGDAMG